MKKQTIVLWLIVIGILCAELGNAALTYNLAPGVFRIVDGEKYLWQELFDNVGDLIFKICVTIIARMYATGRLLKNIENFYLESLVIDLFYCTFGIPFIYHLDKIQLIGMTFIVYFLQIIFYKFWQRMFSPNFNKRKI